MKAPDKIYVCIPQRLNMSTFKEDTKYVGMAYTDRGNLTSPQIEEYIRKDVLLEWAKKRLKETSEAIETCKDDKWHFLLCGREDELKTFINQLNSL